MIIVNSPLMQEEIKAILEGIENPKFKFIKKSGIRLYFETDSTDLDEAALIAKAEIKKHPQASTIYFSVKAEQ